MSSKRNLNSSQHPEDREDVVKKIGKFLPLEKPREEKKAEMLNENSTHEMDIIATIQYSIPHVKPTHTFPNGTLFKWDMPIDRIGTVGTGKRVMNYFVGFFEKNNGTSNADFAIQVTEGCYERFLVDKLMKETLIGINGAKMHGIANRVWVGSNSETSTVELCFSTIDADGKSNIISLPITGKTINSSLCGGFDFLSITTKGSSGINPIKTNLVKPDPRGFGPFPKQAIQGPQPPNIKEQRKELKGLQIVMSPTINSASRQLDLSPKNLSNQQPNPQEESN